MNAQRKSALLKGQTAIAQKVYAAIPMRQTDSSTVYEIAQAMKANTGATADIHILRGCLAALRNSGLVREVVPGSYRQVEVKEKQEMPQTAKETVLQIPTIAQPPASNEPMDVLANLSSRLRGLSASITRIAEDIDAAALAIEERAGASAAELAKVKQIATLLKELG